MSLNKIKEKLLKKQKEVYISKKEYYPARLRIVVVLCLLGFALIIGSGLAGNFRESPFLVMLVGIGFVFILIAILLLVFKVDKTLFWADVITKDGFVYYKLKDSEELYGSFHDAESVAEEGLDWDKDEP